LNTSQKLKHISAWLPNIKHKYMNTHKSALTIPKTELEKQSFKQTKTIERLSSLDVFTSSHNATFVFSPYPLQKSTISRARVGLKSCTFTFNSTSSNHFIDWPVVTLTPIDIFETKLTFGVLLLCQL
jgi:hypothetical protein